MVNTYIGHFYGVIHTRHSLLLQHITCNRCAVFCNGSLKLECVSYEKIDQYDEDMLLLDKPCVVCNAFRLKPHMHLYPIKL